MEEEALDQAVDVAALVLATAVGVFAGLAVAAIIVVVVRVVLRRRPHVRRIMRRCRDPLAAALAILGARTALVVTYPVVEGAAQPGWLDLLEHGLLLAFIAVVVWLVVALIGTAENIAIERYGDELERGSQARRVQTQAQLLSRVAVAGVIIFGVAAMLLTFPGARAVGASLLASAGIVSVVVGLAAQSTIGNLLAGLQIAFTDSIRIDDVVVVEGQQGNIEEITLTYVVVKIWDERRMILPSTYFTSTPFENLTRSNAGMLGSIELDMDWSVPVSALRREVERLVTGHELWDGRTASVAVTEAMAGVVRVRVLLSGADSGKLFDLRSYVRECLVDWIQREAPYAVPVQREVHVAPTGLGGPTALPPEAGRAADEVAEELADELEELAALDDALSATDTFDSAAAAVRARAVETRPGETARMRARTARRQAAKDDRRRAKEQPGALGRAGAGSWMRDPSTGETRVLSADEIRALADAEAADGVPGAAAATATGRPAGRPAGAADTGDGRSTGVGAAGARASRAEGGDSSAPLSGGEADQPWRRSVRDRLAVIGARARGGDVVDEAPTVGGGGAPTGGSGSAGAAGVGDVAGPADRGAAAMTGAARTSAPAASSSASSATPGPSPADTDPHGPRASGTYTGSPEAERRGADMSGPGPDVLAERERRAARMAAEARGESSAEPDPLAPGEPGTHDGDHER